MKIRHFILSLIIKSIQKKKSGIVKMNDMIYHIPENVFNPKYFYTTQFMIQNMEIGKNDVVLDMGTGSGAIAIEASKKARFVVGIDINENAVKIARENAKKNGIKNAEFIVSNLFSSLPHIKFDVILFNPPYLEGKIKDDFDYAIFDYKKETIKNFLKEAKNYLKKDGHIEIVYSSISSPNKVVEYAKSIGWKIEIKAIKKIWGEKLYLYKLTFP